MLKANIRENKADEEGSSSGWTSVRKATKAKAFSIMPVSQSKSASNTGPVKAFTKQKSKSFEDSMEQGRSGPVSEVVSQIQYFN